MLSSSYVTANSSVSPHAMAFRPKIRNTSSSIRSRWIEAVSLDERRLKDDWFIFPTCWPMRSTPILRTKRLPATERRSEPRFCGREMSLGVIFVAGERLYSRLPTSRSSWSRISPPRPSSPSRTRDCSTSCASGPMICRIAAAADRHRRRAQGHQPLDVRSADGARYAGRIGGAALRSR